MGLIQGMKNTQPDIIKAAAIILRDKKLLIAKRKGIDLWISVGGKPEAGESLEAALVREIKEETGMKVIGRPKVFHISPVEEAAGRPGVMVQITSFLVDAKGEPGINAHDQIEQFHWLDRQEYKRKAYLLGSILQDYVVPELIAGKLI